VDNGYAGAYMQGFRCLYGVCLCLYTILIEGNFISSTKCS